jgi:aminoglycoside phosphotransferase (APT) family kinase protein
VLALSTTTDRFQDWMSESAGITGARLGTPLSGGNSNVTRLVESDQGRFILRHPPTETISDKAAAGIEREYRLMRAIGDAAPVPQAIAFCADRDIIGAPFLIGEFIDGVAISETLPPAWSNDAATISAAGEALIDALARVHRIDAASALGDSFGKPEGFVQRQIARWMAVRERDSVRPLPLLVMLAEWLVSNAPAPIAPTIVHCDYHLDNTLFDAHEPRLLAIIDWEMTTIADPRVDLGLVLMFWNRDETRDLGFRFVQRVSNRPGVVPSSELAARWADATGVGIAALDYFRVFAFWRLAAIVEGAFVLQQRGLADSPYGRGLKQDVPNLLREAAGILG